MTNFVLIALCLVGGFLFRRTRRWPEQTARVLTAFVIDVALPAVVLVQIPALLRELTFSSEILVPLLSAWLLFFLALVFFVVIGRRLHWSRHAIGAAILTAGLGNTAFVGYPVLEALYGEPGLRLGVLIDQMGSFLALSTAGLVVAAFFGGGRPDGRAMIRRILTFPPFLSIVAAGIWFASGVAQPPFVIGLLNKLGATLVPLALFSVGFQLRLDPKVLRARWPALAIGLGFKLLLAPAVLLFIFVKGVGAHGLIARVTVLEMAMAPMITAAIVAEDFGLDAEFANLLVGVGIPLSLVTLFFWQGWIVGL